MKPTPTIATVKIRMMKMSMRCLVLGLLGLLLPVIGAPFALAGLSASYQARRHERYLWNPARSYRVIGLTCATFGALIWSILDTVLAYNLVYNHNGN